MTRKPSNVSEATIRRSIKAVEKCGMSVNTVRIEPDGTIVINGDIAQKPMPVVDTLPRGYL